jgi:hypothetical protein
MGLLDDAIREHLDLKRRHGADPAEVERAEREALGPVRRGPEPPDAEAPDLEPLEQHEPAFADEGYEYADDVYGEQHAAQGDELDWDEGPEQAPPAPPPVQSSKPIAAPTEEHEAATAPRPPEPPAPVRNHSGTGDETVEYDVEKAFAEEHKAEHEDVLEETPDFLQDTPDHDRLWFEQRPPKDFDFDG